MWIKDTDTGKWYIQKDSLDKSLFNSEKEPMVNTRMYSYFLNGSIYYNTNNYSNIYSVLDYSKSSEWLISSQSSTYSLPVSTSTSEFKYIVGTDSQSSGFEYYNKYLGEYGQTIKTKFTPHKAIDDLLSNFIEVDLVTTEPIVISEKKDDMVIDGIRVINGHKVLVKDQISYVTLNNITDPDTYFTCNYYISDVGPSSTVYYFYNEENGIYEYKDGFLIKTDLFDNYEGSIRRSVVSKLGNTNFDKEFHLSRLKNGYFPLVFSIEPVEFTEKHNTLLRNKIEYNNVLDLSLYDTIKTATQSFVIDGYTYTAPMRTLTVGEFGSIIHTSEPAGGQQSASNLIYSKYKKTLFSITETSTHYWMCGLDGTLLKMSKLDLVTERIDLGILTKLNSIDFYDDLNGLLVGDFNIIYYTIDGGKDWIQIEIDEFISFNYNKVIFKDKGKAFILGDSGKFLDLSYINGNWSIYKREVFKYNKWGDEYELIDDITDGVVVDLSFWGVTQSGTSSIIKSSDKKGLFMISNDKLIMFDYSDFLDGYDFLYFEPNDQKSFTKGGISISSQGGTNSNYLYVSTSESGKYLYKINLNNYINVATSSNVIYCNTSVTSVNYSKVTSVVNKLFDYQGSELYMIGNESSINKFNKASYLTYYGATDSSSTNNGSYAVVDTMYQERQKSKMLFLDYDIASKVNFYEDNGVYRLPEKNTISNFLFASKLSISSIPGEMSWLDYDRDISKQYRYFSKIGTQSEVKYSTNFRVATQSNTLTIGTNSITNNINIFIDYLPHIKYNLSENNPGTFSNTPGNGYDGVIYVTSNPTQSLMLKDDWMIIKVPSYYNIVEGDTIDVSNASLTTNYSGVINRVLTYSSYKYLYVKTDFNEGIITDFISNVTTIKLLNTYDSLSTLKSNLSIHKLSYSYTFNMSNNPNLVTIDSLSITPKINDRNKYYNLQIRQSLSATPGTTFSVSTTEITTIIGNANPGYTYNSGPGTITVNSTSPTLTIGGHTMFGTYSTCLIQNSFFGPACGIYYLISTSGGFPSYTHTLKRSYIMDGITPNEYKVGDVIKITSGIFSNTYSYLTGYSLGFSFNPSTIQGNIKLFTSPTTTIQASNTTSYVDIKYKTSFLKFGYKPHYNIMDYLNNADYIFSTGKEFTSMPSYNLPCYPLADDRTYIDTNYTPGVTYSNFLTNNKIKFGKKLWFEWNSLFINTFIDVTVVGSGSIKTERLLIIEKYYDSYDDSYVISLHKALEYPLGYSVNSLIIESRRKIEQISSDLSLLNNIQTADSIRSYYSPVAASYSYLITTKDLKNELGFKFNTDSYAKILLSDHFIKKNISSIIYTDDKNELSLNIVNLEKEKTFNVNNTEPGNFIYASQSNGYLSINTTDTHDIKSGDLVFLEFKGPTGTSGQLNPQYNGYHTVIYTDGTNNIVVDLPFGLTTSFYNDVGTIKTISKDPFMDFRPVDLFDVGVDGGFKQAVLLSVENLKFKNNIYSLENIDFNNFKFKMVDGLDLVQIAKNWPWLLESEISDAIIGKDKDGLVWYSGIWYFGRWFGGKWYSGTWLSGDWYSGKWYAYGTSHDLLKATVDKTFSDDTKSLWITGRWFSGDWDNGIWYDGRRYAGKWNNGRWFNGTWNDGTWYNGKFFGGIWVQGKWYNGVFSSENKPVYWIDGKWDGGDFENGIWYGGLYGQGTGKKSRFGTKSSNSKNAKWMGGNWSNGEFHAFLNQDSDGNNLPSKDHKVSQWYTGNWSNGNWYGGIAYNMNHESGIWKSGILEEIQVVGIKVPAQYSTSSTAADNFFVLNGIFNFEPGSKIWVIDDNWGNTYSVFGSNTNPKSYTVEDISIIDNASGTDYTKIIVPEIANSWYSFTQSSMLVGGSTTASNIDTRLRIVSKFKKVDWNNGVWKNGIFESGNFRGGMWYNGVFNGTWGQV